MTTGTGGGDKPKDYSKARELFSAGRLVARSKAKYMRAILLAFAPVDAPGLGTIGVTEHGVLMVDWDFFDRIREHYKTNEEKAAKQVGGALVHEAFHILLKHGKRSRIARRDPEVSNIADDMSFADAIIDMGLELPELPDFQCVFAANYGWPRGETSDQYYERLKDRLDKHGHLSPDPKKGNGDGAPVPGPGKKPGVGAGWCGSCSGRPMPNEPDGAHKAARSKADIERAARAVAQAVREEQQASGGRGTIPGFLTRWADEILAPAEVPWEKELGHALRGACAWRAGGVDYRYDAPSRRQAGLGYGPGSAILPRLRSPVPEVDVIVDTSGSMGTRELGEAGREVAGICKVVAGEVRFCTCDATVNGITKVRNLKEALANLKGGGGTDMRPAFAALMAQRNKPKIIVCITDGCVGDIGPEPKGVKVIWVVVGPYQETSSLVWGKVIQLKHHLKKGSAA